MTLKTILAEVANDPNKTEDLTPRQIVERLDEHIIGQTKAKRAVAVALRNRSRRRKLDESLREEIYPKNIIMIGPTGVGKTEIARRLSKLCGAPFLKVEATKYTEVGYVGRDVESMIRDLAMGALNLVKAEFRERVRDKATEKAEEIILDAILPPIFHKKESELNPEEKERFESYKESREKFREKVRKGILNEQEIEIDIPKPSAQTGMPMLQVFGAGNMEEMDNQIQNLLGDLMPKKSGKRKVKVSDAQKILLESEAEKLIDSDKIQQEAVRRVEEMGIIFLDEIDKIAGREGRQGADVSREGVQRDLLPIVEGSTVNTKLGPIKTDHILFIAAGAFHMTKPSDLIPELQGRFPIRVELETLTEGDFIKILTTPKSSLTKQYEALLATEGVKIDYTPDGIAEIAKLAFQMNEKNENIGARRLNTIMEKLLEDTSFEAPDLPEDKKHVVINEEYVSNKLKGIIEDKDLSRFIL
ncbi:HslU--HslV peptidase ATPase subunit [Leptospira levettii]|uniref:ATP-dependent protease ATPase subunit HslU n=1 Tax=Leptospira levettii TaxID=2023178 RepID=UPI000C2B1582|nr:ATP-dependent protease ATPase subunit HslU [Leptospira levettii]PJZ99597.1 HslU--HslV peptidase ATPase subunit [Leptospira levettii]TGL06771.1 ATP-dependent protease ATPase subunit HslU [Leptospira levettii]